MTPLHKMRAQTLSLWERVGPQDRREGVQPWSRKAPLPASFTGRNRNPSSGRSAATLSRWERVGARYIKRATYLRHDPVETFPYVVIRESQFEKSVLLDQSSALSIAFVLLGMVFTVEFDGHADVKATEVGDQASNWDLPAKLPSVEATIAQLRPQNFLGCSLAGAQFSCEFRQAAGHKVEFPRESAKMQPLTRRLRRHPLPMGEGYGSEHP